MEDRLRQVLEDQSTVSGLTHAFYRYPARLSPALTRWIIERFTEPGELVLDPFVGGGTTVVEAAATGRSAIGVDISALAVFVSRVKTQALSERSIDRLQAWFEDLGSTLKLSRNVIRETSWVEQGYHRNITGRPYWPLRKAVELFLQDLESLPEKPEREFARCVLLRTSQWALDSRERLPNISEFRSRLATDFTEMIEGMRELTRVRREAERLGAVTEPPWISCLHRSAIGIESATRVSKAGPPKLVLTSPPYPGVHVLYHRWQVDGRKETPLPFFISGCLDGNGAAHYTFGDRNTHVRGKYFDQLKASFDSVSKLADGTTVIAQVVGFSSPDSQLPRYLDVMRSVGLEEMRIQGDFGSPDGRPWRRVPNRKWYVRCGQASSSASEVLLFHRKAQ